MGIDSPILAESQVQERFHSVVFIFIEPDSSSSRRVSRPPKLTVARCSSGNQSSPGSSDAQSQSEWMLARDGGRAHRAPSLMIQERLERSRSWRRNPWRSRRSAMNPGTGEDVLERGSSEPRRDLAQREEKRSFRILLCLHPVPAQLEAQLDPGLLVPLPGVRAALITRSPNLGKSSYQPSPGTGGSCESPAPRLIPSPLGTSFPSSLRPRHDEPRRDSGTQASPREARAHLLVRRSRLARCTRGANVNHDSSI